MQALDDAGRVVHRQRGLGDEAEIVRIRRHVSVGVLDGLDQRDGALRQLAHRANHLGMAGMADQHDMAAEALVAHRLLVHLGDQRAGRVEIEEFARLRIGRHGFGHAMGGEDDGLLAVLVRNLVELFNEDRALGFEAFHDIAVVHDLVAHIDRGAIGLQRQHDDLDGAVDAGAETARAAEPDGQIRSVLSHAHRLSGNEDGSKGDGCGKRLDDENLPRGRCAPI